MPGPGEHVGPSSIHGPLRSCVRSWNIEASWAAMWRRPQNGLDPGLVQLEIKEPEVCLYLEVNAKLLVTLN